MYSYLREEVYELKGKLVDFGDACDIEFVPVNSLVDGIMIVNKSIGHPPLNNLRLNAYLYFSQAYSLVYRGKPLFDYILDANPRGPTVRPIYLAYQSYGDKPLPLDRHLKDTNELAGFTYDTNNILSDVIMEFGSKSDKELRRHIFQLDSPWELARNTRLKHENTSIPLSTLPIENAGMISSKHPIITLESLRDWYSRPENRIKTMRDRFDLILTRGDKGKRHR